MKKFYYYIIVCFAALSCCSCSDDKDPEPVVVEYQKPLPVDNNIIAHRGAYKKNNTPHNSQAAFKDAIAMNLYAIEADIHITEDDQVIIYHDDVFHGLEIYKSTYAQLNEAGKLSNGEDLPLLEDFIKTALEGKHTKIWLDVKLRDDKYGGKMTSARACLKAMDIARELGAHHFVEFLITSEFVIQRAMAHSAGDFGLAYQSSDLPATHLNRGFEWANQPAANFYPDNAEKIEEFKNRGIRVSAYMADNVASAKWFFESGIDHIMSNDPEMVLKVQKGEL